MKILFVINDLSGGGAEKVLQLLSTFLAGRGHEVTVVTLQSGRDAFELDRAVARVTLGSRMLTHSIGRIVALPIQARKLSALVRRLRPDICIGNLTRSNLALLMTRWLENEIPALVTEHANTWQAYRSSRPGDRLMRWLVSRFYPRANGVIAVSQGVGDGLLDFGVRREQVHIVHNAIDLRKIQALSRETPQVLPACDVPTIITVGRLTTIKEHELLIRAFALARRRVPARLVLVGQGPLRPNLEALVGQLELSTAVEFAGWQDNPFKWMARADLFVLSSQFEGFGNVIVEAMACELPVISTDCPSGPREILQDGDTGILVPLGDVDALADAIATVLSNHGLRRELAQKSLRRASDFDISLIGARYEALLQSFVRQKTAATA